MLLWVNFINNGILNCPFTLRAHQAYRTWTCIRGVMGYHPDKSPFNILVFCLLRILKRTWVLNFNSSWNWNHGGHQIITQIGGKNMCIVWAGHHYLSTATTTVWTRTGTQHMTKHQGTVSINCFWLFCFLLTTSSFYPHLLCLIGIS